MNHLYSLQHPICKFHITNENNWHIANSTFSPDLFTILLLPNFDKEVMIDEVEICIKAPCVFFLTPYQQVLFHKGIPNSLWQIQFNFHFFCLENHDANIGCNGVLFNNVFVPPMLECENTEWLQLKDFLDRMIQELKHNQEAQTDMLESLLKQFLITAVRYKKQKFPDLYGYTNPNANFVYEFKKLIDENYVNEKQLSFYAGKLFMSNEQLQRQIKLSFSKNFSELIQEKVLIYSKKLLFTTEKTVKEISFEMGFEDPSYFNRYFKKYTGITPETFRKSIRQ